MRAMFQLGPILSCSVKGPSGIEYKIDGYPEGAGYQGYYFEGSEITVTIISSHKNRFSHWLVNGRKINDSSLSFVILSNSTIEPVFRNND